MRGFSQKLEAWKKRRCRAATESAGREVGLSGTIGGKGIMRNKGYMLISRHCDDRGGTNLLSGERWEDLDCDRVRMVRKLERGICRES